MSHRTRATARGFSLLEILVAFTLMALVVAVLMRVFSGGLQGIGLAEDYARASSLAESKLASVGSAVSLKVGDVSGGDAERFRWKIAMQLYDDKASVAAPSPLQTPMRVELFEVNVSVTWSEYGKQRQVSLATLMLSPKL